jgi:hypothetical protein
MACRRRAFLVTIFRAQYFAGQRLRLSVILNGSLVNIVCLSLPSAKLSFQPHRNAAGAAISVLPKIFKAR